MTFKNYTHYRMGLKPTMIISLMVILFFTISTNVFAQYYWVGGTGNWSDYANHWATSSGGTTFHTAEPTQIDDVYFDANSFTETGQTVTLDLSQNSCNSMDWTGTLFFPSVECDFFDDLFIYGSVTFAADVTYNLSEIRLISTGTGNTITSNGSFLGSSSSIRKYGSGECGLTDNLDCDGLYLIEGTFNTNDHDILLGFALRLDGLLTKTINMGASEIHCQQWRTLGDNNTINPGTSTIFTNSMYPDEGESGPYTYNNLTFVSGALIYGSGIFNTINANAIAGDNFRFKGGTTVTFNELLLDANRHNPIDMFVGQETGHVTLVQSTGTVNISYAILSDIHASGGATFNVNPGIDNGNNDGWNFTVISPLNFYWIGDAGNWTELSHWATSTGGTTTHTELPSQFDDVFFDENSVSIASQTITIDEAVYFRNMDWSGIQNEPTFFAGYTNSLNVYGDLLLTETLDKDLYSVNFQGELSDVFFGTSGSVNYPSFWGGGNYTILSDITCSSFLLLDGIVNTNGHTITCSLDFKEGNFNTSTYNLGSSEIYCRDFIVQSGDAIINAGTSTIHVTRDFKGNGFDYYHLILEDEGSVYQSNSFQTLEFTPGVLSKIESSSTQTVLSDLLISGTPSLPISISSTDNGIQGTISKSSGTVEASYVTLKDNNAMGGATFNASQSIDNGNNSGWNISEVVPQDFYWVGGTGDWTDAANHWASSTGGSSFYNHVPGPIDNVYFDANSFSSTDQIVSLDADIVNFYSMDWTGATNNPSLQGNSKTMNIYGSLTMISNMSSFVSNYNFLGEGSQTIQPGYEGSPGNNSYFYFNSGGIWDLQGPLTIREISLEGGTLNINENIVHVDFATYFLGTNTKTLNLGSQEYYTRTLSWQDFSGDNLTINGSTSNIVCSSSFTPNSSLSESNVILNFNNLHFTYDISIDIGLIGSSLSLNTLSIDPGKELNIFSSSEIIVNQLIAVGNSDSIITLHGLNEGIQAVISQSSGNVNGLYLDLKDISATGGATFYANNSLNSGNVSGWIFTGVAQTIDFPVIDDVMEDIGSFNLSAIASSGLDIEYSIVSGPASIVENTITILGAGSVQVQASQSGDTEYNPAPSVTNTFCSTPLQPSITGIIGSVAILTSSSEIGNQWYFNATEIESANEQEYEASSNGIYTVIVDVDGCISQLSDGYSLIGLNIDESSFQSINVYPNPFRDKITIEMTIRETIIYSLFNISGKVVSKGEFDESNKVIDLSTIETGLYILRFSTSNENYQLRVIKK